MTASVFIARLLGPIFLVVGVAQPFKARMFKAILREFFESAALIYLAGFFGLLGGLALVLTHNVWAPDWRLLITLIAWLTLFRAAVSIFSPQHIVALGEKILAHEEIFFSAAIADVCIGVTLSYFGYAN